MVGFAIFGYAEAWGADWTFLLKNDRGEYFYDAESITHPSENTFGVWSKIVHSQKSIDEMAAKLGEEYKNLGETLILWEINCFDKKTCIVRCYDCSKG